MITSWAPTPAIRSKMPTPLRSSSPSMRRAGNLLGTTRTSQPGWLGQVLWRRAWISGGVVASCVGQKGQKTSFCSIAGVWNSSGRRPRSGAMMTHRFWMGSWRRSDMALTAAGQGEGAGAPLEDGQDDHPLLNALEAILAQRDGPQGEHA